MIALPEFLSRRSFGSQLCLPQTRIINDEACPVHCEVSDELAAPTFIAVRSLVQAAILLWKQLQLEAWELQPGGFDLRGLINLQVQATDGKEVCRWTKLVNA